MTLAEKVRGASLTLVVACTPAVTPVQSDPSQVTLAPPSALPASATIAAPPPPSTPSLVTSKSGLQYEDVRPGAGAEAMAGRVVSVHYVGTLESGKVFDSSRKRGTPFEFELGAHRVIEGWDEGVAGMRVGQIRKLRIPPELAYGARGAPPVIGPNATLLFEIELLEVK